MSSMSEKDLLARLAAYPLGIQTNRTLRRPGFAFPTLIV
jgi:hypothetical protein